MLCNDSSRAIISDAFILAVKATETREGNEQWWQHLSIPAPWGRYLDPQLERTSSSLPKPGRWDPSEWLLGKAIRKDKQPLSVLAVGDGNGNEAFKEVKKEQQRSVSTVRLAPGC